MGLCMFQTVSFEKDLPFIGIAQRGSLRASLFSLALLCAPYARASRERRAQYQLVPMITNIMFVMSLMFDSMSESQYPNHEHMVSPSAPPSCSAL